MADLRETIRAWWDADASSYDESASHALSDPVEVAAWRAALAALLPAAPARILDVGAGTGSMSVLAAELGHDVTGLDLSSEMLALAEAKARTRDVAISFVHGAAEDPPAGPFDAVIERHVTWTLPDPVLALSRWREVTAAGGRLILFEGSWGGEGPFAGVRSAVAEALEAVGVGIGDHHAAYPSEVMQAVPLAGLRSPRPFVDAVEAAGWARVRIHRLRDVEWAVAQRSPWPLAWWHHRPRYAIVADA